MVTESHFSMLALLLKNSPEPNIALKTLFFASACTIWQTREQSLEIKSNSNFVG